MTETTTYSQDIFSPLQFCEVVQEGQQIVRRQNIKSESIKDLKPNLAPSSTQDVKTSISTMPHITATSTIAQESQNTYQLTQIAVQNHQIMSGVNISHPHQICNLGTLSNGQPAANTQHMQVSSNLQLLQPIIKKNITTAPPYLQSVTSNRIIPTHQIVPPHNALTTMVAQPVSSQYQISSGQVLASSNSSILSTTRSILQSSNPVCMTTQSIQISNLSLPSSNHVDPPTSQQSQLNNHLMQNIRSPNQHDHLSNSSILQSNESSNQINIHQSQHTNHQSQSTNPKTLSLQTQQNHQNQSNSHTTHHNHQPNLINLSTSNLLTNQIQPNHQNHQSNNCQNQPTSHNPSTNCQNQSTNHQTQQKHSNSLINLQSDHNNQDVSLNHHPQSLSSNNQTQHINTQSISSAPPTQLTNTQSQSSNISSPHNSIVQHNQPLMQPSVCLPPPTNQSIHSFPNQESVPSNQEIKDSINSLEVNNLKAKTKTEMVENSTQTMDNTIPYERHESKYLPDLNEETPNDKSESTDKKNFTENCNSLEPKIPLKQITPEFVVKCNEVDYRLLNNSNDKSISKHVQLSQELKENIPTSITLPNSNILTKPINTPLISLSLQNLNANEITNTTTVLSLPKSEAPDIQVIVEKCVTNPQNNILSQPVKPIPIKKTWRRPWKKKKEREKKIPAKKVRRVKRRKFTIKKSPVHVDPKNGPPIDTAKEVVCRESEETIDLLKQKRQRIKLNRNSGREYINRLGKVVTARKIGPPCNCPLRCWERMGAKVLDIFNNFWDLSDFNVQNSYLFTCLKLCDVKRRYTKKTPEQSRRQNTFEYFVRISGKHLRVCKKGFMSSHGLTSDKRLRTLFSQMKDGALVPEPDRRGKHLRPVHKSSSSSCLSPPKNQSHHPSYPQSKLQYHTKPKKQQPQQKARRKPMKNEQIKQNLNPPTQPPLVQIPIHSHYSPPPPPAHVATMQEPPHTYIPNGEIYFPGHYLEPHQSMVPSHMNQLSCQKMMEAPAYFMAGMKENTFHQ